MESTAGIIFLYVASVAVIVLTIVLVRMANQVVRTAGEVERLTRSLSEGLIPRAERVLDQTANELVELRAATESARRVAQGATKTVDAVGDLTAATRHALSPALRAVQEVGGALHQVTALASGFRTAAGALRRFDGSGRSRFERSRYRKHEYDRG